MEDEKKEKQIDLMDYWRIIQKRRWVALFFAGATLIFTSLFTFLATPQYKSTATLLIEDETSRILNIDEALGFRSGFIQDLRSYNTQLRLLKSKSLAERVARTLNLAADSDSDISQRKASLFAGIKYVISLRWLTAKRNPNEGGAGAIENPYLEHAKYIAEAIEVNPVEETKLVELSFTSPSPNFAAEVINTMAEEFISFSAEKRYSTTLRAADSLTEQISNLRDDIAAKERELQRYGQEKDILFLSDTDTAVVNTFSDLSEAYNQAMLDRINAEAEYRELKDFGSGSVPQFITDPAIQQLKTEYIRLRTDYDEKSRQLKPDHPEMVRLQARLDSLQEEINKASGSAEAKFRAAQKREMSIKATLERQRSDVTKMRNNAILYNSIKSEVESRRKLLNTLLEKQSETQLSAQLRGLEASSISIIDPAEIPKRPISPNKKRNFLMAFLISLFGGIGLIFLSEYLDDTLKGPEDAEKLVDIPSLGVVPYLPPEGLAKSKLHRAYFTSRYSHEGYKLEKKHSLPEIREIELVNYLYPHLPLAEDYRTIRTSLLLSHADSPPKAILFSSALTQEGKTTTIANLAVSLAQLQERVLIVDADLRKPRLHRILKVKNNSGVTSYLTGKIPLDELVNKTSVENVSLIPSGPIPPNPAELLNSKKMKDLLEELRPRFDFLLIDSPPILAVIDPVIISALTDASIIVVRSGRTRRKPFLSAVNELSRSKAKIIGLIFNGVDLAKDKSYYAKYQSYYRNIPYGGEGSDTLQY